LPWVDSGDEQPKYGPPSSAHSNVAAASLVNAKTADWTTVGPLGPDVIVVSGGVASTVHVLAAGDGSTLPAWSIPCTANVRVASLSPVKLCGELQALNGAPLSEHANVAAASLVNSKVATVADVSPEGPAVSVVSGGVKSTVQVWLAGVGSGPAAALTARTASVWVPSDRAEMVWAGGHAVNIAARSSRHWNVADGSSEENWNVALGELVNADGAEVIDVSGAAQAAAAPTSSAAVADTPAATATDQRRRRARLICRPGVVGREPHDDGAAEESSRDRP
jgi:hypothetical protein